MPIERNRYPENWPEISLSVKQEANWTCQHCQRPCRKSGETWWEFIERIQGTSHVDLDWINQTAVSTICNYPQRFTLTTAHLDQNPGNNHRENLAALCSVCHLAHDRPFRLANRQRKLERRGQLNLFFHLPEEAENQAAYNPPSLEAINEQSIRLG